jgi:hypothetical protein
MSFSMSQQLRRINFGDFSQSERGLSQQMSQAVRASIRLGLDCRAIASEAIGVVGEIELKVKSIEGLQKTECLRLTGIVCFAIAVRFYIQGVAAAEPSQLSVIAAAIALAILPAGFVLRETEILASVRGVEFQDFMASFLILGRGTIAEKQMAMRMNAIRRHELITGIDGQVERKFVFLEELTRRLLGLEEHIRFLKGLFPVLELCFACIEFVILDADLLLKHAELF